ncbi:MAG TPA: fibronectin type III domain-containing protein [bacterium]|nr:fibronectin type III domain-containing protein [bacterium]
MIRLPGIAAAAALIGTAAFAVEPPVSPRSFDTANDGGRSVTVEWDAPVPAEPGVDVIVVRTGADGEPVEVGRVPMTDGKLVDRSGADGNGGPENGVPYEYRLSAVDATGTESAAVSAGSAVARPQLFNRDRFNVLILLLLIISFVLINVVRARNGAKFFVRRLAPVDAMDEAIGRATEMGRPVLYVPGIEEVEDIQTIASMLILGRIARKTAELEVPLRVPTRTPFVMAVADEVVRAGYMAAGRPDAYREDDVRFISSEQFAYCAGVNGMILRDRPAANFYLGRFFAESLIFAETGFAAGSIQIAGTAEVTQLPFFIAACDYTLIGEEFFAAGAYLSQDEMLLSTLKAADWTKVLLVTLLLTGSLLMSLGYPEFREWFVVR